MKITVKCPGGPVLFERVLDAREVVRVKRIINGEELPGGPNAEGVILLPGQHLDVPGRPLARQGVPMASAPHSCPKCHSTNIEGVPRSGILDRLLAALLGCPDSGWC